MVLYKENDKLEMTQLPPAPALEFETKVPKISQSQRRPQLGRLKDIIIIMLTNPPLWPLRLHPNFMSIYCGVNVIVKSSGTLG